MEFREGCLEATSGGRVFFFELEFLVLLAHQATVARIFLDMPHEVEFFQKDE